MPRNPDREEAQVREVYARYGLAVYLAQCVERQLALLLATRYGPDIEGMTPQQYNQLLDSLFQQTFGALMVTLRETVTLPVEAEARLRRVLERRNWLIHNYFWERAGHLLTPAGRAKMIAELEALADEFEAEHQRLLTISRNWAKEHGVTEERLQAELERLIQRAEAQS